MGAFAEGSLIHQLTSTVVSASTTTLTVTSTTWQRFTGGASGETVVLPDATTMRTGREFVIENQSGSILEIQFDSGSEAGSISPYTSRTFRIFGNGTSDGDWVKGSQVDLDEPLSIHEARPTPASYVTIESNQLLGADGTTKSTPPGDDAINLYSGLQIDFQTGLATGGTAGGTVTTEGGPFTRPSIPVSNFVRLVLVYQSGNNAIDTKFSIAAASQGALENAGALFASLDGTPIGYIDLEYTANFNFKTPGAGTFYPS